jgi:hypothetical protein
MLSRYYYFLISLYLLFSNFCLASDEVTIRVILESDARLYIDSKDLGRKSSFELKLPIGEYSFKILFSSENSWNRSLIDTTVEIDSDTTLYFSEPKLISLISQPSAARIYYKSEFIGLTPIYLPSSKYLRLDDDSISLRKEGYLSESFSKEELMKSNFSITLERDESLRNSFIDKNIKYFLLGSATIFGGLSSYFKQVANNYFYQTDQSSSDLSLVRKYDRLSAVFSTLLQINFGLLVYLLLSE